MPTGSPYRTVHTWGSSVLVSVDFHGTVGLLLEFDPVLASVGIPTIGPLSLTGPKGMDADASGFVHAARGDDRVSKFGLPATLTLTFTGDGATTPDRVFTLTAAGQTTQTFVVDVDRSSPEPSTVVSSLAPTTWNVSLDQTNVQVKQITCSNGVATDDYEATAVDLALTPTQSVSCEFYVEWIG